MQATGPLAIFFFVLGLTFGSFGNVLILRLPRDKKIIGRSQCPKCKAQL
ncbi:prepilin peptidase, partial [Patescibacteria group bacterium]|nr:prepilin peptidase [Patescibacteria group bacterium]